MLMYRERLNIQNLCWLLPLLSVLAVLPALAVAWVVCASYDVCVGCWLLAVLAVLSALAVA
jgi:hypothetical protein